MSDLACLDANQECAGAIELRMPLTASGRSFPRCDHHWERRLKKQEEIDERYPDSPTPPAGYDWFDAGEDWDEDQGVG